MAEFYDPMLYMSTPEHPNTMGMSAVLTDEVDHDILSGVVEDLRCRFPYFYVRAIPQGADLVPETDPLPMTVRGGDVGPHRPELRGVELPPGRVEARGGAPRVRDHALAHGWRGTAPVLQERAVALSVA